MTGRESLCAALDRLAFWWLRRRNPQGVTVMRSPGEQSMLSDYDRLAGTERS